MPDLGTRATMWGKVTPPREHTISEKNNDKQTSGSCNTSFDVQRHESALNFDLQWSANVITIQLSVPWLHVRRTTLWSIQINIIARKELLSSLNFHFSCFDFALGIYPQHKKYRNTKDCCSGLSFRFER